MCDEDEEPRRVVVAPLPSQPESPIRHWLGLFGVALRSLNAEIVIFFVYVGWAFGNTLQAPGLYRRICETYYERSYDNCSRIDDRRIEHAVQEHTAEWSTYNAIAYLAPALIVDTMLGAYGDKYGRQINILLGICGIAIAEYGILLTLSESVHAPYMITPIVGLVAGSTGYIAMVPVSCNAYLADITDDVDLLTIRAGILSAAQSLASVVGGVAAAFVDLPISIAMGIEILLYLFAFYLTLFRIPQRAPQRTIRRSSTVMTSNSSRKSEAFLEFFVELRQLLRSGFDVYTRSRVGHRRAFMLISMLMLMVTYTTAVETRISPVVNSFVFRRASGGLDWTTRELGLWNGVGYLLLFLGNIIFLPVFKSVLRMRETTIILIAIVSGAARCIMIGFSTQTWHMYLANLLGMLSGMVQPAVVSFVVQLVPYDEIGRAFSLFGIGADLAFIVTNVVYNNIYRGTVRWFAGFMFVFIGGVQMIVFFAMLWVHFGSARERIGENTAITRDISRNRIPALSADVPQTSMSAPTRRDFNDKRHSLFPYE